MTGIDYTVPSTLRTWLADHGFEVGVHDLYHDGKLFLTEKGFRRNVPRINHYLKDWDAAGFRSGFMLSELDWLHGLDIQYDCSTFDTDPFEPQPDGVNTIFPFWVPAPMAQNSEVRPDLCRPASGLRSPISAFQRFSFPLSTFARFAPGSWPLSAFQRFSFSAFGQFDRLRRIALHLAPGLDSLPAVPRAASGHLVPKARLDCKARRHGIA